MSQLRIFSYLPNPRIFKATIAARIASVDLDIRGAKPGDLADWLWDFDARPLTEFDKAQDGYVRRARKGFGGTLVKTDEFLSANPFGTVPVAFSADGEIGIFESNSILRCVARLGDQNVGLYGNGPFEASRIDAFLDVSLIFARDTQIYLLALAGKTLTPEIYAQTEDALEVYLNGIESALSQDNDFLTGSSLTLADICFAAEWTLLQNERRYLAALASASLAPLLRTKTDEKFPRTMAYFQRLKSRPEFAADLDPYFDHLATIASKA